MGKETTRRWTDLPEVTQLEKGRAGARTQTPGTSSYIAPFKPKLLVPLLPSLSPSFLRASNPPPNVFQALLRPGPPYNLLRLKAFEGQ